jgi:hypothetical protein
MTMAALHATGGVPAGWMLTPPAGSAEEGRTAFVELGCPSCHRVGDVTPPQGVGPELTGMGGHHPPAYFVESIVNPDAVLVEGPGYLDASGHSTMPDYPDLTIRQVADLVAYLQSLTTGGSHGAMAAPPPAEAVDRPDPPAREAKAFLVQSYDVRPGSLEALQRWIQDRGGARLRERGVVSIDTYVDFTRPLNPYTSLFGFRDGATLQAYAQDAAGQALEREFDAFVSTHEHTQQMWAPIYRAPTLSVP